MSSNQPGTNKALPLFSAVRKGQAFPEIVTPPQLAASSLTRSGAATHRSEASHPPPVSFLFWRGSSSGSTLFYRRTVSWQLSVMETPVALPPILERMEQRMLERRRFPQTEPLENGGSGTSAQGSPRHSAGASSAIALFAEPAKQTTRMTEWLTSRGLQAPKEVQ